MDDGSPKLEVLFEIATGGSYDELLRLQELMGSAEMKAVLSAKKMEQTLGNLNFSGTTATVTALGSTTSAAFQKAEKAAERLTANLKEQTATFGMTRAAATAWRAEQAKAKDAAAELRQAEAALIAVRAQSAAKLAAEASATARAAEEHARLAAMVRGSQAAQKGDAVAAERLRASTDPLYAATKRLNAEIAESTRLYHAGATAPAEYARQQQVLSGRLATTTTEHNAMAKAGAGNARSMAQLALQLPDIAGGLLTGQKPMTVFIQQGGQLAQVAMMAEGGIKGMALAIGRLALGIAPLAVVAGIGFGAFKLFQKQVEDDGSLTRYRNNLGLTHKEMLQLSDGVDKAGDKIASLGKVSITAGDMMAGLWKTIKDDAGSSIGGGVWDSFKTNSVTAFKYVLEGWNVVSAGITAGVYGTFNAVKVVWSSFPAVFGDIFIQGVNAAIGALNKLVKAGVDQLNSFIATANRLSPIKIPMISAPQIDPIANSNAGATAKAIKQMGDGFTKTYSDALKDDARFWKQSGNNALQHNIKRQKEQADAIKANRTDTKPKVDRNALNAEATEAEIRNLYKLADAYGVSGAAALIAEARVKAESQAIKSRGDVDAAVARQIALVVAQRTADTAKVTAAMRDQTVIQKQANAAVASGNLSASQASEFIRDRMADLPALAAIQAAVDTKNFDGAKRLTTKLNEQRDARLALTIAEQQGQLLAAKSAGDDQLAMLAEEARLIGATDAARVHALATLKAAQEVAKHQGWSGADGLAYIAQQEKIADAQQANTEKAAQFNEQLRLTSQLADDLGASLSRAFGRAGSALGGVIKVLGHYGEEQQKIADQVRTGQISEQAGAKLSANTQINGLIDITDAAKGLFAEHSAGYKAMEAAEKALTIIQLARTAIDVAGGAARMFASLGPFAFPAVAAMLGVMASLGFGGGSSGTKPAKANDGTGTVLGDSSAKSDSIKNAIDALKDVDTLTNTYARTMSASLKSIDSQIGGFAAQIVRAGNVNASDGVTEGFKSNTIGSVLSHIPLIGGLLGSLFGTKTTVVASGLYGGQQSVGSILSGGYDAQYYSDVQKKKKFLGITTGTSYSTKYTDADAGLENQFTLILKSFNDSIAAAAGPLGVATSDVQSRLNGFIVNIGKIDLTGLSGTEIQDKLSAVFGAAADGMANAAFPAIAQFQKVGEGAFETLVRVASTLESVSASLDMLGNSAQGMGMAAKLGLADQFDSVSALTDAVSAYFTTYYSKAEQAAAQTAQMAKVFGSLGLAVPTTLNGFRQLVEAQDLNTAAGQATYATLLKLAPAFADLQTSMEGVKSAADIASEKLDLQRQLLELQGNTAAIRALDLAKLDESNRGLQQQIWAVQDAKAAADAAKQLSDAWTSVGDSILAEVNRIRGISDASGGTSFSSLMGQFNAATIAARGGDQDAAKSLPGLSQALLTAAGNAATSRQELDRIQAQTAASLEATFGVINSLKLMGTPTTSSTLSDAAAAAQAATAPTAANDDLLGEIRALRDEVSQLRTENNNGHLATATNTGRSAKTLENVTGASGGDAIAVTSVAA